VLKAGWDPIVKRKSPFHPILAIMRTMMITAKKRSRNAALTWWLESIVKRLADFVISATMQTLIRIGVTVTKKLGTVRT